MLCFTLALTSLLAVEVLDVEMDPAEKKKTGVYRLNDKEKAELQTWIDNTYLKRAEPVALKTTPKEQKASIQENLNNGTYIRLSDNSLWNIRPSDTPISQGWITPVDIIVTQSGDPRYPYKLTNSVTGSAVLARKASEAPQPHPPLPSQGQPELAPTPPVTPVTPSKK